MLWYNSPESVRAIHDARCASTVDEGRRLMRLIREDTHRADN
jgi:hypothetical protein